MKEPIIIAAYITNQSISLLDGMPKVMVMYEGGTSYTELFEYYPDKISFNAGEFINLTKKEAINLKFKKDKNYLWS